MHNQRKSNSATRTNLSSMLCWCGLLIGNVVSSFYSRALKINIANRFEGISPILIEGSHLECPVDSILFILKRFELNLDGVPLNNEV